MASHKFPPYVTSLGIHVHPTHYTEVPEFDPDQTESGRRWYAERRKGYSEREWNQEYEIDFRAGGGGLVYFEWDARRAYLIEPIRIDQDCKIITAIDPGVIVTAAIWKAMFPAGVFHRELPVIFNIAHYYEGSGVRGSGEYSASDHARNIIAISQHITDTVFNEGEMSWHDFFDTVLIDPSSSRREGATEDLSSIKTRYFDAGIDILEDAQDEIKGGVERVKEWEALIPGVKHPNGIDAYDRLPTKFVFPASRKRVIDGVVVSDETDYYRIEKERYHYPNPKDTVPDDRLDLPVKKYDHLMDVDRYGDVKLREFPARVEKRVIITDAERARLREKSITPIETTKLAENLEVAKNPGVKSWRWITQR